MKLFFSLLVILTETLVYADGKMRIISLTPATTEILFALNLGENVVAVTTYCNYPAEAKKKEKIGTFSSPDIEKIFLLKPDIVFTTDQEQGRLTLQLKKLGIKTFMVSPKTVDGLILKIREIGQLTGRNKEADELTQKMKKRIDYYKSEIRKTKKKPRVFVEIYSRPVMTACRNSFIDDILQTLGCQNVFRDMPLSYCQINPEAVIEKNPEWIIMLNMQDKSDLTNRGIWRNVDAVKNGRIIDGFNPDVLLRPGPRIIEGMDVLFERIYKNG